MSKSDARKLGKSLAMSKREEQRLAENITPDDPGEQVVLGMSERFRVVRKSLRLFKNVPDEAAIVFDRNE